MATREAGSTDKGHVSTDSTQLFGPAPQVRPGFGGCAGSSRCPRQPGPHDYGFVTFKDHGPGRRPARAADVLAPRPLHLDVSVVTASAVPGRDRGGLAQQFRRGPWASCLVSDDHVGPCAPLRVEPEVLGPRQLERQSVVVAPVLADQDAAAVGRGEDSNALEPRPRRGRPGRPAPP